MLIRALLFVCLFISAPILAIEVTDLYQSTLAVSDKTRATRVKASQQALMNVIKKLTGRYETVDHPSITRAKRSISDYMLKYEYLNLDDDDDELKIRIKFEANKVEDLVRTAQLPFWGNRRPMIAIWLAIEDDLQRDFVTQERYPQLGRLIYDTAAEWGVPVVVPLLDLQDRASVGIAEVWGNFSDPVEQASIRYNAERVITARMFKQPHSSRWQLEWRYTDAELFESNQLVGDKQQVLIQMINDLSSVLVANYVIDPAVSYATTSTIFTIDKLESFTHIERAKRQLKSISTVADVDIIYRSKDKVKFEVEHTSSLEDLIKAIKLEQAFSVYIDPRAFYQVADAENLKYSWVGP
ncbi:DUF2066 domain-containing protein [Pseudoalteromonas aurantia]|uniref:DUF2066 domain-containing protein n=1 Tax=Pseudoalteromonas aurantia 208 TaxID=1314867 RepID=A0ABR9E964_9GAMM|nr:DUF2066 domain-containing protein [Pseudoalteromonas aurantia]MBE0367526.1 hypothetical protein [Pseudoalteromonas aurantia 208]